MSVQRAIYRLMDYYNNGRVVSSVIDDDVEYGGGDPELADDIAKSVDYFWDK